MTEPVIIHILGVVWKWLVAPMAIIAWWLFRRRDERMNSEIIKTERRIRKLETRMNDIEKSSAVIHSKINDLKEDNKEIKELLYKIHDRYSR